MLPPGKGFFLGGGRADLTHERVCGMLSLGQPRTEAVHHDFAPEVL